MDYNYTTTPADPSPLGNLLGTVCLLFICLLFLAYFVFYIWMLIDAAQKQYPKENENEKILWIILILFIPLSAVLYYFIQRPKYQGIPTPSGEIVNKPQESDQQK